MDLTWNRSSGCTSGTCVEVAWTRSTRCYSTNCVEVVASEGWILVRDSKNPDREPISYRPDTWMSTVLAPVLLHRIPAALDITDGYVWHGHTVEGEEQWLHFTGQEWDAFTEGVRAAEFHPEALGARP